jgi:hypothetical protein
VQDSKNNDSVSKTTDLLGELLGEPKQEPEQEQQQQPKQPEPPSEAVAEVYRAAAAAAAPPPRPAAVEEPASGRSNPVIAGADANLQVRLHSSVQHAPTQFEDQAMY